MTEPSLKVVQRWMHDFIADPGTDEEAERVAGQNTGLPPAAATLLFRPSKTLEPFERIMIYRGQYLMRMAEALTSDYPALQQHLGEDAFLELVTAYVQEFPSRSYTLNRLGDHFPEFVAACSWLRRRRALGEMARLELAMCQVFDEEETPPVSQAQIESRPADTWGRATLVPIAALRVLELQYPVNDYVEELLRGSGEVTSMRQGKCYIAVYRRKFDMFRLDLTRPAYLLLRELMLERPLEEALDAALSKTRGLSSERLFWWFRRWMSEGFFQAIN